MQALVHDGKQPRVDARHPEPSPGPGDVVIRPLRMGVCATDLEICRGYLGFKGVLGHEFVGIVESGGARPSKATAAKTPKAASGGGTTSGATSGATSGGGGEHLIGKRVVGTINCVCGRCDMCRSGLREHCRDRTVLGIAGRDGCFSDRFTLPARNLLVVPDDIDDDQAVFVEPLAAAYQILRQLNIEGRPYITVLGDGRLGLLCAQVMSQLNATVRCVGKHPEKLGLCEKWGVKHRLLDEVGLRADQDIVVDCTGSASGLETAMQMVRPRGTIVLKTTVAPGKTGPPLTDLSPLVIHEIRVIGSRCGPFPDALAALSEGRVDVLSLISRRMKLADGVEALKIAARPDVIKVLLEP